MTGASEYGAALFSLTEERSSTERVLTDLHDLLAVLKENPDYILLLDTPALSVPEKRELAKEALAPLDDTLLDLIMILCEKHAVHLLPAIGKVFVKQYDEARGILRAEAVSAVAMTEKQKQNMIEKLSALTGKTVVLRNTVDPSILGGITLRYAGTQLDHSVKTRLERIADRLKEAIL